MSSQFRPLEIPAIVRLFLRSCPAAIIRSVWAVVVDAVELVQWRWFAAHVGYHRGGIIVNAISCFGNTARSCSKAYQKSEKFELGRSESHALGRGPDGARRRTISVQFHFRQPL